MMNSVVKQGFCNVADTLLTSPPSVKLLIYSKVNQLTNHENKVPNYVSYKYFVTSSL